MIVIVIVIVIVKRTLIVVVPVWGRWRQFCAWHCPRAKSNSGNHIRSRSASPASGNQGPAGGACQGEACGLSLGVIISLHLESSS